MYRSELEFESELNKLMRVLERSDLESEIAEFEGEGEIDPLRAARDLWVISAQGAERNENKLTDAIFYDRHPEWKGRSLKNASVPLRQEWIAIRDNVVRAYLKIYPAQPAAPPVPAPQPAGPPAAAMRESFGFSQFANTLRYEPQQYPIAIAAQNEYRSASAFQPYYNKISNAWPRVLISLDPHGVGNLVFSMDGQTFSDFVESGELKQKAGEIMAGGLTGDKLIFREDVIGMLGLALTMIDLATGLENERMAAGVGSEYDKWRAKQQLQFTFALMAEDLTRAPWGPLQFFSRDPRSLAVELASRYAGFQPIYYKYAAFFNREQDLGNDQGNVPNRTHDTVGLPPPGL